MDKKLFIGVSIISLILLGGAVGLMSRLVGNNDNNNQSSSVPVVASELLVNDQSYSQGDETSAVILVEFSDFQCPACAGQAERVKSVINQYPHLKLVYRHFPLSYHQYARPAAVAAEAAGRQGKFWEMHDLLFANQGTWESLDSVDEVFTQYARDLGLNIEQYQADLQDQTLIDKINQDVADGNKANVDATPTFFLNGQKINLADPSFEVKLQELLAS